MLALCVSNTLGVWGSSRRRIKGSVKRLLLNELELTFVLNVRLRTVKTALLSVPLVQMITQCCDLNTSIYI